MKETIRFRREETSDGEDIGACIDYLRFKFMGATEEIFNNPSPVRDIFYELLNVLKVSPRYVVGKGRDNLELSWTFDHSIQVLLNPREYAKGDSEQEYFVIVLSGSACREYEERGGSWTDLFDFYLKHPNYFYGTRIDLAIDDYSIININEIGYLVTATRFAGTFRGGVIAYPEYVFSEDPLKDIKEKSGPEANVLRVYSRYYPKDIKSLPTIKFDGRTKPAIYDGWSFTWGKKGPGIQFQIYDKKAERKANAGLDVLSESWTRFEMRFGKIYADQIITLLGRALREGQVYELIANLIGSRIRFLDKHNYQRDSINKAPTWPKWIQLIGSVRKIELEYFGKQYLKETVITSATDYLENYAYGAIANLVLSRSDIDALIYRCLAKFAIKCKINNQSLAAINYELRRNGEEELTQEAAELIALKAADQVGMSKEVLEKTHLKTGEIMEGEECEL